jgi:hypothetical protein
MVTNVTIAPVDGPVVVYWQDGTSEQMEAQQTYQRQIIEGGVCTISDTPTDVDGQPLPPGQGFIEKMREWWNKLWDQVSEGGPGGGPEATPH